jgi:hypothetical protein
MKIASHQAPRLAASLIARVWQRCIRLVHPAATPISVPQEPGSGSPAPGGETEPKTRPGRWPELPSKLPSHGAVVCPNLPPQHEDNALPAATNAKPIQHS